MYIIDWKEFYEAAEKLYLASPSKVRYCLKYRHSGSQVVLKVTDDTVCIKYRTDRQEAVKQITELNNLFLKLMTRAQ